MDIVRAMGINIPRAVVQDILQYLNPKRLHKLASYSTHARQIINGCKMNNIFGMDRDRYIYRWLSGIQGLLNRYTYTIWVSDCIDDEDIENSYWYLVIHYTM